MGKCKRIPIKSAKEFAEKYGYSEIIIFARDGETGMQSVCTWGKTLEECKNAAEGGNAIKKSLGWPEELCEAKPARVKRKEKKK